MRKGISVVLPAFRERRNLETLLPALLDSGQVEECVVVDDPSGDDTEDLIQELQGNYGERIRYKKNLERLGLARSIAAGVELASFSHVLVRDSDWNHEIALLPELRRSMELGHDFVVASRYMHGIPPLGRLIDLFSFLLNWLLCFRFGAISDWTYGYYLLRRDLVTALSAAQIFRGRGEYTVRLYRALLRKRIRPVEIRTVVQGRGYGESSTSLLRHGWPYLRVLLERSPPGVRELYDGFARRHGITHAGSGHSRLGWRARTALLDRFPQQQNGRTILDLGCGNGAAASYWARNRKLSLVGVDFSERTLEAARSSGTYQELRRQDVSKESLEGSFDGALCFELLQYLPRQSLTPFFSRLADCAKPGAQVYVIAPHREGLLHRLRRLVLGRWHPDYCEEHGISDVVGALERAGFRIRGRYAASYFLARIWSSETHETPPWWSFVYGLRAER